MNVATAEQHREISTHFLEHAEDELRKGDLLQASEKAWGAVSHYVNSIARQRNWPLGSHRRLIENANKLISGDPANASHKRRYSDQSRRYMLTSIRHSWTRIRWGRAFRTPRNLSEP